MKTAILISGQPRNFQKGYQFLKEAYLDRYDCDIFLHTWDTDIFQATQFMHDRPAHKYQLDNDWTAELLDLYKPTRYKLEAPIVFDDTGFSDPMWRQPLQNSKSMWYSVKEAFSLTNKGYDCYIRTRFDLQYEQSTLDLEGLDLSKLHVWNWDTDIRVKHRGYYDVFAIGSYENIGIYSSVYSRMDWYLNNDPDYEDFLSGGWPGQDTRLRNEYLLRWHLKQSGVSVEIQETLIPHADGQIIR